ncbi:M48 family metalloprotease [Flavilitoribacter nigricans]|uniref:Peptidase M48 domain-containing protein n=1 Tax=Flavilitoribacter nigricans (strain ATCC 23147 / DSM 23189 / NBRC 102662 / NCIMB 1420 / SS-2) TaxID=1122177 RepID=A0A2D0NH67_FLAN2|nr:hypothetical protein [Flavilitoribacter nigricans]PHN07835.1 hypothetical protein CRP01_03535 [Flavilitoribacter nigricans DSM 23189 = NBRC 102662]
MSVLLRTVVFILCVVTSSSTFAQDSLFAFVQNGRSRALPKEIRDHKYETAKHLYDQLIQARGDSRKPVPKFVMNAGERYVAWMNPFTTEIGLEETAYDVCTRMGADSLNAMAALLAHEITHYYENHDWSRSFVSANKKLDISTKIGELNEGLKFEVQADYLGGILAISAGYNTYNVFDKFLKQAYEAYDLPAAIEGYPNLEERLITSASTAERLRKLHNVYLMANLLTLLEAHATADQYYQNILTDFQSYEVYNNAGVNACLGAIHLTDPLKLPYAFPLELDLGSRLDGLNTREIHDADQKKAELLRHAESWLKNAIELAPEKPIGYLNLAIVYTLREAWLDATYFASKALALSQQSASFKQSADAQIALGIINALQDKIDEARTQFTLALPGNRALAQANLARIQGPPAPPVIATKPATGVETIEEVILEDVLAEPQFTITSELPNEVICGRQNLEQSELLIHYVSEGEYALFHQTMPNYEGATQKGIRLGDQAHEILRAYGDPPKTLELPAGRCLSYPEQHLLFLLNDQNQLQQWIVYSTKL